MVTSRYALQKPRAPSPAARYLHWNAVPSIINALGAIEAQVERLAVTVRRAPAPTLAAAFTAAFVLALLPRPPSRRDR
jgi:predicted secreted protein